MLRNVPAPFFTTLLKLESRFFHTLVCRLKSRSAGGVQRFNCRQESASGCVAAFP